MATQPKRALSEVDDKKRLALFQEAVRIVINDQSWLPLHFQHSAWAMRSDIDYVARTDERTQANDVELGVEYDRQECRADAKGERCREECEVAPCAAHHSIQPRNGNSRRQGTPEP